MTSADEKVQAAMRAYADSLQPPPVADVIARAEDEQDNPQPISRSRPRPRRPLLLAAAAALAALAVVAIAADQLTDRDTTAAPKSVPSTSAVGMAPACPPGLPVLEGILTEEGTLAKPIEAKAGQQLALTARIPAADPDRRLRSFQTYLLPTGADTNELDQAVAKSPALRLQPGQESVTATVQIPAGLTPGTYDIVGYATFPSPSVCGVKNRADQTQLGSIWGVLGSVVIK